MRGSYVTSDDYLSSSARLQERAASLTIRRLEIFNRVKAGDRIVERTERSVLSKQNYDQTFAQASSGEEKSAMKFLITLYRGNFFDLFVSFPFSNHQEFTLVCTTDRNL